MNKIQICLGTANFGLKYGTLKDRIMDQDEVFDILIRAHELGVTLLDTAPAYGNATIKIGRFLAQYKPTYPFEICTKIPSVSAEIYSDSKKYMEFLKQSISASRSTLNINTFHILLFHQCEIGFLTSKSFLFALAYLKQIDIAEHIGVSIYDPSEAMTLLKIKEIDYLQVPANILDHRFIEGSLSSAIRISGKKLMFRSIFLQGLLAEDADLPKSNLPELASLKQQLLRLCAEFELSLHKVALTFLTHNFTDDSNYLIFGVNSKTELENNCQLISHNDPIQIPDAFFDRLHSLKIETKNRRLTDPRNWNREST